MASKVLSYIGFAIKAGKVRTGVNVAKTVRGHVPLMILCESASDNTVKEATQIAQKLSAKIVMTHGIKVEDIFYKQNCKLALVTDNSLAKAILANLDEQFVLFGGNKI
ncbi:MAG: hypothetical protein IJF75_03385 [Clostridia bacterium]|nr:hypothetical protein [Clostridia bacterium]